MSIYNAIDAFAKNPPANVLAAQVFLNNFDELVQDQLIAGLYLGEQHAHNNVFNFDVVLNRNFVNHIQRGKYAEILVKKSENAPLIVSALLRCAASCNFDLKSL